jgi:hypothetical protein
MYTGQTVFSQLMASIPSRRFYTCVKRYGGNRKTSQIQCLDLFYIMAFSQLTRRHSLRGTVEGTTFLDDYATFAFGKSDASLINDKEIMVVFWATKSCITHIRWAKIKI